MLISTMPGNMLFFLEYFMKYIIAYTEEVINSIHFLLLQVQLKIFSHFFFSFSKKATTNKCNIITVS